MVDDQRGSPTWTRDLAEALVRLAEGEHFGTFHCTNSGDCTWHDLAVYVLQSAGVNTPLSRIGSAALERPAPRPAYSVLNNQAYEQVTGQRLAHWQDAVHRFLMGAKNGPKARPRS